MITILIILFVLISIPFIIEPKNKIINTVIAVIICIILILVAGLREKNVANDYFVYYNFWITGNIEGTVEYSLILIKSFIKNELDLTFTFFLVFYAVLGVTFKVIGIRKLSPLFYGSILIYLSHYYLLHEITQVRIGVATGFILISYHYLCKKDYVWFFAFMAIAIFFHQSSSMALILILVSNTKRNLVSYLLLLPIGYLLYFSNSYFNLTIPIPYFQSKIEVYKEATEAGFIKDSKINVFNILFLLKIIILYTLVYFKDKISESLQSFYFLIKVYCISLFTFLFFSDIPVFAFRIQELFGVVDIILIPSLIFIFSEKFKWTGKLVVWCLALGFLLINIYYNKLILR